MSMPTGISGSRSAPILGISNYSTTIQVWLEMMEQIDPGFCNKHGYKLEPFKDNNAVLLGNAFEPSIQSLCEKLSDDIIIDAQKTFYNKEYDFITCRPDGIYSNSGKIHNAKTTSEYYYKSNWGENGRLPLSYMVQVQHEFLCIDSPETVQSVLCFPKRQDQIIQSGVEIVKIELEKDKFIYDLKVNGKFSSFNKWTELLFEMGYFYQHTIEPDKELHSMMLERYYKFWHENILGGKMPDPVCINDIKQIYTEPFGTVIADETIERLHDERKLILDEIKELTKKADQNKFLIQDYMRTHDGLIDTETREKTVLYSRSGKKLASYDGKVMR